MKARIALGTLACYWICSTALAAGAASGVSVVNVRVDQDGRGVITFNAPLGNTPPSCVESVYASSLAFDANTAGGRSALAMFLTAKSLESVLTVYGLGTCSIYGGHVEDLNYGVMQ